MLQSGLDFNSWLDGTLDYWGIGRREYVPPVPMPVNPPPTAEPENNKFFVYGFGVLLLYLIYKELK